MHVGENTVDEGLEESQVRASGADVQVQPLFFGRDIPVYERGVLLVLFNVSQKAHAAQFVIPFAFDVSLPQQGVVQGEAFHVQARVHDGVVQHVMQVDFSGNQPVELHGMELDDIHDVLQVDVAQVYQATVGFGFSNPSVCPYVLVTVLKQEITDINDTFINHYLRGMYIPDAVIQDNPAGLDLNPGVQLVFLFRFIEMRYGLQLSAEGRFGIVSPIDRCPEAVFFCQSLYSQIHHASLFHAFVGAELAFQSGIGIVAEEGPSFVIGILIGKFGSVRPHLYARTAIVEVSA